MKAEKAEKKVSNYSKFDKVVITLSLGVFILGGGMFWLIATSGISFPLFLYGIAIYVLGCVIFYIRSQHNLVCKRILIAIRIIGISMILIAYSCPLICINFTENSKMYPVKKFIYIHGVKDDSDGILPDFLYSDISDYYFRTEVSFPAQDYKPCAYLAFHTSSENLKKYEEKLRENPDYKYSKNVPLDEEEYQAELEKYEENYKWTAGCPEKMPQYVYQRLYESAGITDNLDNSVLYVLKNTKASKSYSGALINHETGLIVIWR